MSKRKAVSKGKRKLRKYKSPLSKGIDWKKLQGLPRDREGHINIPARNPKIKQGEPDGSEFLNKERFPTTEAGTAAVAQLKSQVHTNVPMPELAVRTLPIGVYFDDARHTAIVYRVGRSTCYIVHLVEGTIDAMHMQISDFTRKYCGRWPAYPVRRAARIYLNSQLPKTDAAAKLLRALVVG